MFKRAAPRRRHKRTVWAVASPSFALATSCSTRRMSSFCRASGVRNANNVLVGGGGIFVKDAESVTLESSFVSACSVEDAFSVRVLPCGGGAIGITNVPTVRISSSKVYNNSDSSLSGAILLQQLNAEAGMVVNITNGSLLSSDPSISALLPVLNISCGSNCSAEQQQRVRLNVIGLHHPRSKPVRSALSINRGHGAAETLEAVCQRIHTLRCNFSGVDSIAALARSDADRDVGDVRIVRASLFTSPWTSQSTIELEHASQPLQRKRRHGDSCRR